MQFPDIVHLVQKQIHAQSYIIEGEIVPVGQRGRLLPFQVLMQRRRKRGVEAYMKTVPVCLFVFDLLYVNGKSFLREPYLARRAVLEKITGQTLHSIVLARQNIVRDIAAMEEFFTQALAEGCEGIMAKEPNGAYQAGTRGWLWIKWKKEYAKELSDTFDLVIVGAFFGRGKRAGSYGALLCAAYNDKTDAFETVCKLGSGFSDELLAALPKQFKKFIVPQKPARIVVNKLLIPDVWFEPKVVAEVLGAELTKSPIHTCAWEKGQGIALRFPRFVRFREDKSPEQATTTKEIVKMYERRLGKKK